MDELSGGLACPQTGAGSMKDYLGNGAGWLPQRCAKFACCVATLGLAALAMPKAVAAHSAAINKPDQSSFDLLLAGRIKDRCQLSGGGTISFGELVGQKTVNAGFDLECNVPFVLAVTSRSGGLAHTTKPLGEGPFAGTATYQLNVFIPTLSPSASTLHAAFDSAQLRSGGTISSGEGIAVGSGRIEVKMDDVQGVGLLAGDYTESLNITISQRL